MLRRVLIATFFIITLPAEVRWTDIWLALFFGWLAPALFSVERLARRRAAGRMMKLATYRPTFTQFKNAMLKVRVAYRAVARRLGVRRNPE